LFSLWKLLRQFGTQWVAFLVMAQFFSRWVGNYRRRQFDIQWAGCFSLRQFVTRWVTNYIHSSWIGLEKEPEILEIRD